MPSLLFLFVHKTVLHFLIVISISLGGHLEFYFMSWLL